MINEKENRDCALEMNSLIFDLQEKGYTNNSIANGVLFALSIHILNSGFSVNEIIEQLSKLFATIKYELGNLEDGEQVTLSSTKPINPQWD
jgi:hypothetical protein